MCQVCGQYNDPKTRPWPWQWMDSVQNDNIVYNTVTFVTTQTKIVTNQCYYNVISWHYPTHSTFYNIVIVTFVHNVTIILTIVCTFLTHVTHFTYYLVFTLVIQYTKCVNCVTMFVVYVTKCCYMCFLLFFVVMQVLCTNTMIIDPDPDTGLSQTVPDLWQPLP